jgi:protein SCO1/2
VKGTARGWFGLFLLFGLAACHAPGPPGVHTYSGHGIVEAIAADHHRVTIHHQAIPGYMAEMTMEYPVRNDHLLDGLIVGDTIDFTLETSGDDAWIGGLHRTGQADPAAVAGGALAETPAALKPGDPVPNVGLLAENGQKVHLADFRGNAVALTFFFTRCPLPTYCPLMNRNFAQTRALLLATSGAPKNWQFLSVSFDPEFDTPQKLASYATAFRGANADRWLFASLSPDALGQLASSLGLVVMRQGNGISHNLRTVVIDPQGRLFRQFNDNAWSPHQLEAAIQDASERKQTPATPPSPP